VRPSWPCSIATCGYLTRIWLGRQATLSLLHGSDAELAAEIGNVLARPAPKGWAIDAAVDARTHQTRRIVGAQAAMLAVHRAMTAPRPPSRAMSFGAPPWG